MNIENMLNQLKSILPSENFKIQPSAALEELLQLEKKYNLNTSSFIKNSTIVDIPEEVKDKWFNQLEIFIQFDGLMEDINHISPNQSRLDNQPFIHHESNEEVSKQYIKDISKESNWLPCLFY